MPADPCPGLGSRVIAGRYSLDREIGRGGAGVVWLGRDEVLGRQVALKRIGLLPGADHTDLARAEREAQLGARLTHPHLVGVFDAVVEETGAHWLVMEYVDGVDLGRLVRDHGPLPPDDAAPLLRQVADALVAAHAAGITHRDVKPSNILIDRGGTVKLTDFGIARVTTDVTLTQTGLVTGSPAYLAPEVAAGERGGAAADVWSLGATTFHVLAGRAPYEVGDNVLGALYRIVHEDPPRLPDAGWMAPLLAGTMVKDPNERWTMAQVRDFLSRTPNGEPVPVPPSESGSPPDRTRVLTAVVPAPGSEPVGDAPRGMSRAAIVATVVVALVVVLGVALYAALSGGGGVPGAPPSPSAGARSGVPAAGPTAKGMEAFIRKYVSTVSSDPDAAWAMLTPRFQQESGGLDTYRRFWDGATNGKVLSISADPAALTVSYQVHFDHFHNGPGPTVLDLKYVDGKYLIDAEHTKGFAPVAQSKADDHAKPTKPRKPDKPGKHGHHGG